MSASEPPPPSSSSSPSVSPERQIAARLRKRSRWITIGVVGLLVMAGSAWLLLPKAKEIWRARQARDLAARGDALMKTGLPEEAFPLYAEAIRKTPNDSSLVRLMARCLDELPGAEKSALRCWNQLLHMSHTTWEDTVAMGQSALRNNDLSRARQIEAGLPKESHGQRKTREFHAAILEKTGKVDEARQLTHALWSEYRDDPECRVRLASLEVKSSDKAIRDAAVATLWETARGEGKLSAIAMIALAECRVLGSRDLAELARLVGNSPVFKAPHRYQIFHQCVEQSPELLPTITSLAREIAFRGPAEAREQFYQWASAHKQTDMVLNEIPEAEAMKSHGLFLARVDSLMRKRRWDDLKRMLDARPLPVSKVDAELMRAYLASRKGADEGVRTHLHGASLYAAGSNKASELAQVGAGAQNLGHADIALEAFGELARLNTPVRLQTLARIYALSEQERNATGMLQAANALLELEPGLVSYAGKAEYLRLICGIQLDEAVSNILFSEDQRTDDQPLAQLSRALAAFRSGDHEVMKKSLQSTSSLASQLEPGPRATLAGLLWQAGKQDEAIAIAGEIPRNKILEEERAFLNPIKMR